MKPAYLNSYIPFVPASAHVFADDRITLAPVRELIRSGQFEDLSHKHEMLVDKLSRAHWGKEMSDRDRQLTGQVTQILHAMEAASEAVGQPTLEKDQVRFDFPPATITQRFGESHPQDCFHRAHVDETLNQYKDEYRYKMPELIPAVEAVQAVLRRNFTQEMMDSLSVSRMRTHVFVDRFHIDVPGGETIKAPNFTHRMDVEGYFGCKWGGGDKGEGITDSRGSNNWFRVTVVGRTTPKQFEELVERTVQKTAGTPGMAGMRR